jgi:hypothetical protein
MYGKIGVQEDVLGMTILDVGPQLFKALFYECSAAIIAARR